MPSIGAGVQEIRIRDAAGAFRVIYVAKFADAVYILHCLRWMLMAGTGLSQVQAAKLSGVTQPRVSDLMRGKIDVFGLDALVNMAAGLRVKLSIRKAA
jgi:phage-related protein